LRAATTAQIDWDLTSWTDAGWNNSPSILSVIQEIVNRGGWAANNYIGLIIKDDGSVSGRSVWGSDYSGGASLAAKLHVEYTTTGRNRVIISSALPMPRSLGTTAAGPGGWFQ
jgi:hypothetical protein